MGIYRGSCRGKGICRGSCRGKGIYRGICRSMAWNGQGHVPGKDRYPGRSVAGAGACLPFKALPVMKGSFHHGWLSLAIYIDKPG